MRRTVILACAIACALPAQAAAAPTAKTSFARGGDGREPVDLPGDGEGDDREGKVELVASPDTPTMSDQRNYLFAEVDKDTAYAAPPPSGSWVGTAPSRSARPATTGSMCARSTGGFLLGEDFLPAPSFLTWSGDAVLTPASPSAVLWQR